MVKDRATSWDELLACRDCYCCVGRQQELERFRLNYLYDVPQYLLFVLLGPSGVGKSALMSQYFAVAREHGMVTASTGQWDANIGQELAMTPPIGAMKALADDLAAAGMPLTTFQELYREYAKTLETIAQDPDAPGRVLDFFGGVMDKDPWAVEAWDTYLRRTFPIRRLQLIQNPVAALTERFTQDLNAWATVRRVILGFDDWQVTEENLGPWLLDILLNAELSLNIWIILASETKISPAWEALSSVISTVELAPLSSQDSRTLLKYRGWVDSEESSEITMVAGGMPLWLDLLSDLEEAELSTAATNPFDAYLSGLSHEQRSAVLRCSAARWLDEEVVTALLGHGIGPRLFEWLTTTKLVIQIGERWRFRPSLWDRLMTVAQREIGPAWSNAHRTLLDMYQRRLERHDDAQVFRDLNWWESQVEILYHSLIVEDEVTATNMALESFLEGLRQWYPWAGAVVEVWQAAASCVWSRYRVVMWSRQLSELWTALQAQDWDAALVVFDTFIADDDWITDVGQLLQASRHMIAARLSLPPDEDNDVPSEAEGVSEPEDADASWGEATMASESETPPAEDKKEEVSEAVGDSTATHEVERVTDPEPAVTLPFATDTEAPAFVEAGVSLSGGTPNTALHPQTQTVSRGHAGVMPNPSTSQNEAAGSETVVRSDAEELSARPSPQVPAVSERASTRTPKSRSHIDLCNQANAHLEVGAYEAAIKAYDEAIAVEPNYVVAYYNRGLAYGRMGALGFAIADFGRVIEREPSYIPAYRQRGLAYVRKGELSQAIEDFTAALKRQPDAIIYHDRANAHYRAGAYERAIADYNEAIRQSPDYTEAYLNRGLAYAAAGNLQQALRDYNETLAREPSWALAYHYRGQAYAQLERYDRALADYTRALELNPQYAATHNNRGLVYVKVEAYADAIDAYKKAMALSPDWATPYYNAACAASLSGDAERACTWLSRAISLRGAYRAMALRDPDFVALREVPCFKALLDVDETSPGS